ncbi:MAG: hypothetical protein KTR31_36170 [Myxococcales bacterium]|nr:hypothetical protein [Myxococcales bacterium]
MQHARRMAGYNAPLYVIITIAVGGGALVVAAPFPDWLRGLGGALAAGAAWFGLASFAAFYWLFDRSPLLDGRWVAQIAPCPARWVQLSVFLEQTTLPMGAVFPKAEGIQLDLFHPEVMTEPAVNRARLRHGEGSPRPSEPESRATPSRYNSLGPSPSAAGLPDALDVEQDWADLVVVMLVAHELRDPTRRRDLFGELARITSAQGRIVLVEHTRNLAALLAYGPGWWHFLPEREWRERSREAGLDVLETKHITPFVQVFVLGHAARFGLRS